MSVETLFHPDQKILFSNAAERLRQHVLNSSKPTFTVALPGGRSVVGLLKALAEERQALPRESWMKLHFFMVDERRVPLEHQDSNFKLVRELFFEQALKDDLLTPEQLHPFIIDTTASGDGIEKYSNEFKNYSDKFDLMVLGVGEDAHVGALFPDHHSIRNENEFFITMDDSPKPPPKRMTASKRLMQRSLAAFALFTGEAKREALQRFRDPKLTLESCPAKIINSLPNAYVVTDLKE